MTGMEAIGFESYLTPGLGSHIITSFRYPEGIGFDFETFYERLSDRGFVIYPGKVTTADCFRIGTIGRLFPSDVRDLLAAIAETVEELGLAL